ncbi:hypothetical protein [Promicromonospora sp. MEB111]|uniref:hypothetical protein n=1 Tax=Promicromonospora sp. MEB111 TaxID=3040301 RepID=UPI00254FB1EA|nr:hypothetical protein [Promicromonospora sp. MEB111]
MDDYARLTLLDGALTISTGIAMLTAILTFMLGIDTVVDSRTGWVQPAFFYLILAAVLIIEIGKLDAFPKFAGRSRLLVKTTLARSVAGRRDRARRVGHLRAARTLGMVLAIHCAGYLALARPAGRAHSPEQESDRRGCRPAQHRAAGDPRRPASGYRRPAHRRDERAHGLFDRDVLGQDPPVRGQ